MKPTREELIEMAAEFVKSNFGTYYENMADFALQVLSTVAENATVEQHESQPEPQYELCPKCGDTVRCAPATLDSPDGQECDCTKTFRVRALRKRGTYKWLRHHFYDQTYQEDWFTRPIPYVLPNDFVIPDYQPVPEETELVELECRVVKVIEQ